MQWKWPSPPSILKAAARLVAPGLIFLTITSLTIGLRHVFVVLITVDLEQASRDNCSKVGAAVRSSLNDRILAVRQFAGFFSDLPITREKFSIHGQFLLLNSPQIIGLIGSTPDGEPFYVATNQFSRAYAENLMRSPLMAGPLDEVRLDSSESAKEGYSLTDDIDIPTWGQGFALLVPIKQNGKVAGSVCAIFANERIIASVPIDTIREYSVEIAPATKQSLLAHLASAQERPPRTEDGGTPRPPGWEEYFAFGRRSLRITVKPGAQGSLGTANFISKSILALGSILAALLSGFVFLQQRRAERYQTEAWVSRNRLAATGSTLAQIQENLNLILNNVNEGVILYDSDLTPLQVNVAFRKAFGAAFEEGRLLTASRAHHRAMGAIFQNTDQYWALFNRLRENPDQSLIDELEVRREREDQPARYYQRRATGVIYPDGERRGFLVIYQDITTAMSIERLKEDFLSSVTHDLRTPLASIKGFAETMIHDRNMDPDIREEFASIIRSESMRLEEMIEDLLDLRRMEDGRTDLSPVEFDLYHLIGEATRAMQPVFDAQKLKVDLLWEGEGGGRMFGDPAKLSRAIRNVLGNSVKYSPPGSHIMVHGLGSEDRIELEITDEGSGIPPDEIQHVFEKFYRGGRHVRRTKGTGLGLAIVKHIVQNHGGVVTAHNGPERGTTIRIVLPREPARLMGEARRADSLASPPPAEATV